MKTITVVPFSAWVLVAMSACVQPASDAQTRLTTQTAGPQKLTADRESDSSSAVCRSVEGSVNLSRIGEGAEALFQILLTDPEDLTTVHDRANRLVELEQAFGEHFALDCQGAGLTPEKTAARIEKLSALAKETDSDIVRALAREIWDLFNPNIGVQSEDGTSSANPFSESAAP